MPLQATPTLGFRVSGSEHHVMTYPDKMPVIFLQDPNKHLFFLLASVKDFETPQSGSLFGGPKQKKLFPVGFP